MNMQDKELFKNYGYGGLGNGCGPALMYGLILIGAIFLLSGCKSIQYVPVETVRTEYKVRVDTFLKKDSFVVKDSVYIHEKNDTVFYKEYHTRYIDRWKEVIKVDTLIKTDSIQVPYPVEKKLSRWQQIKMDTGGIAIGGCVVLLLIMLYKFFSFLRRKAL